MGVKDLDDLGEVGERSRQPIDLVDNDHIDFLGANIFQNPMERWTIHRAARISASAAEHQRSSPRHC